MDQATHNKIVSFIWGIADDVLRDLFKRGKYPDVILPMCVLRRMDAVLEPTKKAVLETKAMLDTAGITEQRAALAAAAGQSFYNTSRFTLRDLKSRGSQQQLLADFEDYLNGFSQNVQDILENFKFRNQLPTLSKSDSLGTLIAKFLDPEINLSPEPVRNGDGTLKHPGLDNHSMGTVFEELVRKFNEENNEEAGEHWTPRDAVRLMTNLMFLPVADRIKSGGYLLYDCACGTGDAGQGESNILRWIIENDWLEAIVALPLNLFYNTGIATYIWVLSNRKPAPRKGKVQLIDALAIEKEAEGLLDGLLKVSRA
jgi:type I restriction enzyme M protein